MMIEDRTRFEVLLEDIQTRVKVIAEGHVGFVGSQLMWTPEAGFSQNQSPRAG